MSFSRKLTIFEGPDGGGKTTLARSFAKDTGALYIHHGPYPHLNNVGRVLAESMLPAVQGYTDVVLDRCWLSEKPYGTAYRDGKDRLGVVGNRLLERLAFRCATTLVLCLPEFKVCRDNFLKRKQTEYLDNEEQLKLVYDHYTLLETSFRFVRYNYTEAKPYHQISSTIGALRSKPHTTKTQSAGNLKGSVLLVGEKFAEIKDTDTLYQWPFGSFSNLGCSRWLTERLQEAGIPEYKLCWANADQDHAGIRSLAEDKTVVALGNVAHEQLTKLGIDASVFHHPQSWKRFNHNTEYPLITYLKEKTLC